jgi:acyl carrier protein
VPPEATPGAHAPGAEIGERIGSLLADIVGPERAAVIDADTNLVDDVMLDSIQMIAFLLRVEDELDVEIDFESLGLDHVRTLRAFTGFLLAGDASVG